MSMSTMQSVNGMQSGGGALGPLCAVESAIPIDRESATWRAVGSSPCGRRGFVDLRCRQQTEVRPRTLRRMESFSQTHPSRPSIPVCFRVPGFD